MRTKDLALAGVGLTLWLFGVAVTYRTFGAAVAILVFVLLVPVIGSAVVLLTGMPRRDPTGEHPVVENLS